MILVNGFIHQSEYPYGENSARRLNTCTIEVRRVMMLAANYLNISILCGARNKHEQERAFREGKSELHFPDSDHNITEERPLSEAVDAGVWNGRIKNVDYKDEKTFGTLNGVIQVCASLEGCVAIWGGSWKTLNDMPHWLIISIDEAKRRGLI